MATTKTGKKKQAPIRKAKRYMKEVPGIAARLLLYAVVTVVLGLLLSVIQGVPNAMLRMGMAALLGFAVLAFYFMEGMSPGTSDAMNSRQMAKLEKMDHVVDAREDASCYHPLKAVMGSMMLFAIPLVLAIVLAVNAKPYTYELQDLPSWISGSYGMREDVMAPLGAYTQALTTSVMDWIRIVVRLFMLVFINFFGEIQTSIELIDRLSPLFILLYPIAYVAGYLCGPAQQAKLEKMNRKAKKVAVRKHQKKKLVDELLGNQNVPHYGQRAAKSHKKKELI